MIEISTPVKATTIVDSARLRDHLGVDVFLASETFQQTGSFKFRAAYNVVFKRPESHLICASSGNFGQALAYACKLLGKRCTVVMPATSAQVKIDSVRSFSAVVDLINTSVVSRNDRVDQIAAEFPGCYIASPFDDPFVIEGNATLGAEIAAMSRPVDIVIAPVGGGGLTSGLIQGIRSSGRSITVFGAEPLVANDAARSLREGQLRRNEAEPQTIADGARTISLGNRNWEILRAGLGGIVEVPESAIEEGTRLLFRLANLKAEPTGALSVAALLVEPERFQGMSVCCVISGGNVDPSVYCRIISS